MKKLILLISLFTLSCSKEDIGYIDADINFMPVEIYQNSGIPENPKLKLKLFTEKEDYPCINFILNTSQSVKDNELVIRFEEIIEPAICLTAIGPAISLIDLPEKITELTFINGDTVDRYSITINQEKITIELIEKSFTNSLYDTTFRYPENSFAYVSGTNTYNQYLYEEFLKILEENPNFTRFEFEGEGRVPYPLISSGHWVDHPSRFFKYSDNQNFENLEEILQDFSSENIEENSGASISIYGWDNTNFHSWLSE